MATNKKKRQNLTAGDENKDTGGMDIIPPVFDRIDPRLAELVRLIARRAAEQDYIDMICREAEALLNKEGQAKP